jgi:hypothetical protein
LTEDGFFKNIILRSQHPSVSTDVETEVRIGIDFAAVGGRWDTNSQSSDDIRGTDDNAGSGVDNDGVKGDGSVTKGDRGSVKSPPGLEGNGIIYK